MKLIVEIKKQLGTFLLDVTFETSSEVMGVLGGSGCGKSMTLKCIAGIETPDSGYIALNGKVLYDSKRKINLPPQKRQVGYLFQSYALFPNMSVAENIGISVPKASRAQMIEECTSIFRLEGLLNQYPRELSGGQQQRVALARIMASRPEVLLLDEPFAALDSYLKWQLEQELIDALEAFGKPVLFVSHHQEEIYHLCDTIGLLYKGKMGEVRSKKDFFEVPRTRAEAELCGYKNIVAVEKVDQKSLWIPDWQCQLTHLPFIPERIKFIGIGEDAMIFANSTKTENVIPCDYLKHVESINHDLYILKPIKAKDVKGQALYIHIDKDEVKPPESIKRWNIQVIPEKIHYLTE